MNFSEFLESMHSPLYEAKGEKKCPKGFRYDKKLKQCVAEVSSELLGDPRPDSLDGYPVWGATGIDGDGYAMEDDSK